ncbi:SusC/RagA family TonB-linked outer membrane protein [Chitinophaga solisilvae]|uniref:SusC/RagA family TonB-linked outer membrane protein n=1 Tax=Chitinophaga solisilvae TaxID=1233460 RepID=UPI00136C18F4|nr:SusC/RagA family TonB-linked outer membrane protein [Chitinophaga solisilvae]
MRNFHVRFLLLLPCTGLLPGSISAHARPAVHRMPETHRTGHHAAVARLHTWQQTETITGEVIDVYGKPLTDVAIRIKSGDAATVTDTEGKFRIRAERGATLVFSLHNYLPLEKTVEQFTPWKVVLQENPHAAENSYHLLNDVQPRQLQVQSSGELRTPELSKTTSNHILGLINGRLAGARIFQGSGEPGNEAFGMQLRGMDPILIVDGNPDRPMMIVNPEEIESVTVLKDALATAMLGIRGANGAVLITTRRGHEGPQRISFSAQSGIQTPVNRFKPLGAYDYARLYNEALANDGKPAAYTQSDLDAWKNKTDPYGHPDVDWWNQIIRERTAFHRFDLTLSGGRKVARYFVNLDYLQQGGMFKSADINKYKTNADYNRYIVRSNVDFELNRSISASVNLFGRIQTENQPGAQTITTLSNLLFTPNNAYPVINQDGSLGGTNLWTNNLYGQTVHSGYRTQFTRDLNADVNVRINLQDVTPGLWAKATASFFTTFTEQINRSKSFAVYQLIPGKGDATPSYLKFGNDGDMANSTGSTSTNRFLYTEAQLGYTRQYGAHGLNILLNASKDNRITGNQVPQYFLGSAGRIQYNYREKYMLELAMSYSGTNRYPKNKRYGWFPAIGAGWDLAKENFLRADWLNQFKLRATYGTTGDASDAGYYAYLQYYQGGSGYNFGNSATGFSGVREGIQANPQLSWARSNMMNLALDMAFFDRKLSVTIERYHTKMYDLLQTRGDATLVSGLTYPLENLGINRVRGIDITAAWQSQAGSFHYYISGNLSMLKKTVVFNDEVPNRYAWMNRTGQPVNTAFGYLSDGLFQTTEEISNSAKPFGYQPVPGDIKYKDLNNDGKIDQYDMAPIMPGKPQVFYGATFGCSWKNFDVSVLLQGVANRYETVGVVTRWEFQLNGLGQAYEHHLGRWTPENAATATYPRLSIGTNINNHRSSDYWIRNTSYMRLKNVELGYNLPAPLLRRVKLATARVFLNGTNLLTFSPFKDADPENIVWGYPIQKVMSAGLTIKF